MPNERDSGSSIIPASAVSPLEDEKQETLLEIEELVRAGRRPIGEGQTRAKAGSSGALLPAIVAAGSLVLMGAAAFIVPGLYNLDERRLASPADTGPAGGAELYTALREEAGEQIQEREQTIGELQTQYNRARSERETLRREFDSRLAARAKELESGIAAELEAERRRLASEGLAEAAVAQRLKEFQERQELERRAELQAFQARLEAEASERDRQLAAAAARYNEELKRSTDPLKAEIERLAAEKHGGEAAQAELSRRYETALAENERLRKDYEGKLADLERSLRNAEVQAARLAAAEAKRTGARERVDALLKTARGEPFRVPDPRGQQDLLLDLLKAKTEVRDLLSEEPAKSSRPGLGVRLDRYFDVFESEYRNQGRKQGLAEAYEAVDSAAADRPAKGLPAGDPELARFLERLRTLMR